MGQRKSVEPLENCFLKFQLRMTGNRPLYIQYNPMGRYAGQHGITGVLDHCWIFSAILRTLIFRSAVRGHRDPLYSCLYSGYGRETGRCGVVHAPETYAIGRLADVV